ncbi:hypothetical protein [Tatumella ptyseos]|uniref:hypothetical protein n=1 Tax=Tatumella ptyseos TaxID=82987 RepID=UPI0026F1B192|nr:hypothetical protein [Tatumella ptyseos]WKX25696.1 hypothetical protein QJR74_10255 [Tatumella ptyseos]
MPSCEQHNTQKSIDDMYLLFFLAVNIISNALTQKQFSTKIMRAINRSPHVFIEFTKKSTPVILKAQDGEIIHTTAIEMDRERFESAIKHISHALYYHKFRETFIRDIQFITSGLVYLSNEDSVDVNNKIQNLGQMVDNFLTNVPSEGDNPEIFNYKSPKEDEFKQVIIQINFYCNFNVISIMRYS